jgi:energy-coupling factor transporter ATP-binding protein EcfA2
MPDGASKQPYVLKNTFLRTYLQYTADTESPPLFHAWSLLAGIAAVLGRRCYYDFPLGKIFPNLYILLVGPPAVRKSTALTMVKQLIKQNTGVRFAPDDTSGQRQGLIAAMSDDVTNEELKGVDFNGAGQAVLDQLSTLEFDVHEADRRVLFVTASEFNTFIGHNSIDLLPFLTKVYDGEDYQYRLKTSEVVIQNPLLNIIGGTTPTNIATALPPEAIGQGFMSRIIMVFANKKNKSIPRPAALDERTTRALGETFSYVYHSMAGEFIENAEAAALYDQLYDHPVKIDDNRFLHYMERRPNHLRKTAMCLAAAERRLVLRASDYEDAHWLLQQAEATMPEALGEYGMNKVTAARQKLTEYLDRANGPVTEQHLWIVMQRDMNQLEFRNSIADLLNSGRLKQVVSKYGVSYVAKNVSMAGLALLQASDPDYE